MKKKWKTLLIWGVSFNYAVCVMDAADINDRCTAGRAKWDECRFCSV